MGLELLLQRPRALLLNAQQLLLRVLMLCLLRWQELQQVQQLCRRGSRRCWHLRGRHQLACCQGSKTDLWPTRTSSPGTWRLSNSCHLGVLFQ